MNETPLTVLLIEDNAGDARLIREILGEVGDLGVTLEWVDRLHLGLDRLAVGGIDGVLLDLFLPDSQGIDTFRTAYARAPHVPIIALTGLADEAVAAKAVREGAQDYIVKGQVEGSLLVRALRYAIERKQAEEQLRLQSTALGSAANAIVITDRQGNITWVNPAFTRLTGYSAEEAVGRTLRLLKSGKHDPSFYQSLWETILAGKVWHGETINRRKDGSLFTEEQTITPVRDERGDISHFIAVKQDIIERKQVEMRLQVQATELATKTERLEATAALSRTLSATLNPPQVLDFVVAATVRLLKGNLARLWLWDEPTEILRIAASAGDADLVAFPREFSRPPEGMSGLAFAHRQSMVTDAAATDPRYKERAWALAKGIHAYAAVPLVIGDRGVGVLTAARRAPEPFSEEELTLLGSFAAQAAIAIENARLFHEMESTNRRRLALNQVAETVNQSLDLQHVLDAALDATLKAVEVEGGNIRLWDEQQGVLAMAARRGMSEWYINQRRYFKPGEGVAGKVFQRGETFLVEDMAQYPHLNEMAQRDGVRSVASIPIRSRDKMVGVMSILSHGQRRFTPPEIDLLAAIGNQIGTALENARLYEGQRLAARQLETTVETRTEELQATNVQLHEALRRAEEASRSKSRFLAAMSHELRTPLNAIIGFSELLEDQQFGLLNAKQQRYVSHVQASGRHLLNLINDILDLAKVEADRLGLEPMPFALPEVLKAVVESFRPQAEVKEIAFQLSLEACPATLIADPLRFKQIVLNLLSNAVKFTLEGGTVTVSARLQTSNAGKVVEIIVQDTGIGIRAEDLPKLFQEFTQLDASLARRHQGTGLGLALTKKLVELHGGTIHAHSPGEGRGSTFTLILPLDGPGTSAPPAHAAFHVSNCESARVDELETEIVRFGFQATSPERTLNPELETEP